MTGTDPIKTAPTGTGFAITVAAAALAGMVPVGIIASSNNGYVAGYVVLPVLLLIAIVCGLLVIAALVFMVREKFAIALYLLVSIFLLPSFALGFAISAKHFGIGAYRVEPMRQFPID